MPGGARRSLASPVVSGVLCQCGGGGGGSSGATTASPSGAAAAAAAASTAVASEGSFGSGGSCSPSSSSPPSLVEHERRLQSLFLQLDVNRDGALCIHDLAVGLERLGLHRSERDLWSLATLLSLVFSCISCLDSGL